MNAYMEDDMGVGEPMPEHVAPNLINGLKKHVEYRGFFITENGEYAALANCNMNFGTFAASPVLNIHDFIVLPGFRKIGIGHFLMQKIIEYATENDCNKITLEVRHDNIKAKNLYLKTGFSEGKPPYLFWEKNLNP